MADDDPVMLDGAVGSVHVRRVLEELAVVEPLSSHGNFTALLDRLKTVPAAAVVVVGAGRGDIADAVRNALGRPVAYLDAARPADLDFYEPPVDPMWKQ